MSYRKKLKRRENCAAILVRTATKQMAVARATSTLTRATYLCHMIGERVPSFNNSETPARHAWPRSNICGNLARAIPNHTSKPLPSQLRRVPRRPHSPPCAAEIENRQGWCSPCSGSQQRPQNAANGSTHAATQRCTSVVKVPPTETAM